MSETQEERQCVGEEVEVDLISDGNWLPATITRAPKRRKDGSITWVEVSCKFLLPIDDVRSLGKSALFERAQAEGEGEG